MGCHPEPTAGMEQCTEIVIVIMLGSCRKIAVLETSFSSSTPPKKYGSIIPCHPSLMWLQCSVLKIPMIAKRMAQVLAFGCRRSAQQSLHLSLLAQPCGDVFGTRRAGQGLINIRKK
jgi:hypothetical protein